MPRKLSRVLWTTLVAIVALVAIAFLVMTRLASNKIRAVQTGWEETLGSTEQILERFPSRGPDETALGLERLTARLGIDIATRGAEGRDRPAEETAKRYNEVRASAGSYLERQLVQTQRASVSPPGELLEFLEEHAEDLAAIRELLAAGDPPRWEMSLEEPYTSPIPNLLGHINLQKLLIADVMVNSMRGKSAEALEGLEASWRLNAAIREDPYLITQLIAIAVTRLQAGALRQLEQPPAEWRVRLFEHNFRDSLFTAMLLESWGWTRIPDPGLFDDRPGFLERASWTITKPFVKYCLADMSDDYRRRLLELNRREAFCDYYGVGRHGALDLPVPSWNVMGDLVKVNMTGALDRLARLELELELTTKVLHMGSEAWDERIERSSACPEDDWLYEIGADGAVSIAFSRDISWPEQIGVVLPTRFSVRPVTTPSQAPRSGT